MAYAHMRWDEPLIPVNVLNARNKDELASMIEKAQRAFTMNHYPLVREFVAYDGYEFI